jgi:hypothetical protein
MGAPIPERWHFSWRKKLKDCTIDELNEMAWHSICQGGADDLRHWLPRLLEINDLHPRDTSSLDLFFVTNNLCANNWHEWPTDERDAIDHWFTAWWEACLRAPFVVQRGDRSFRHGRDATECLRFLLKLGVSLSDLLPAWRRDYSEQAIETLAWAVTNREDLNTNYDFDMRCGEHTEQARRQINEWLQERGTASQLERAFFEHIENQPLATTISQALYWYPPEWVSKK